MSATTPTPPPPTESGPPQETTDISANTPPTEAGRFLDITENVPGGIGQTKILATPLSPEGGAVNQLPYPSE